MNITQKESAEKEALIKAIMRINSQIDTEYTRRKKAMYERMRVDQLHEVYADVRETLKSLR